MSGVALEHGQVSGKRFKPSWRRAAGAGVSQREPRGRFDGAVECPKAGKDPPALFAGGGLCAQGRAEAAAALRHDLRKNVRILPVRPVTMRHPRAGSSTNNADRP